MVLLCCFNFLFCGFEMCNCYKSCGGFMKVSFFMNMFVSVLWICKVISVGNSLTCFRFYVNVEKLETL